MIYKLYKVDENQFHVLVSPKIIGEWYFDIDGYNENTSIIDWSERFEEFLTFLDIASNNGFLFKKFNVVHQGINSVISDKENLSRIFSEFLSIEDNINSFIGFNIECIGNCIINPERSVDIEILGVQILRNNTVSIAINTKNLCFLPHNPVTKNEQYELWKHNAPKLAKTLSEFSKKTSLSLLTDGEYWRGGGAFNKEHPFYLMNAVIHGKKNPEDLDEFYMPFDLLDSNDLIV